MRSELQMLWEEELQMIILLKFEFVPGIANEEKVKPFFTGPDSFPRVR